VPAIKRLLARLTLSIAADKGVKPQNKTGPRLRDEAAALA